MDVHVRVNCGCGCGCGRVVVWCEFSRSPQILSITTESDNNTNNTSNSSASIHWNKVRTSSKQYGHPKSMTEQHKRRHNSRRTQSNTSPRCFSSHAHVSHSVTCVYVIQSLFSSCTPAPAPRPVIPTSRSKTTATDSDDDLDELIAGLGYHEAQMHMCAWAGIMIVLVGFQIEWLLLHQQQQQHPPRLLPFVLSLNHLPSMLLIHQQPEKQHLTSQNSTQVPIYMHCPLLYCRFACDV